MSGIVLFLNTVVNHGLCAVLRPETPETRWYLKAVRHGWYSSMWWGHAAVHTIEGPHAYPYVVRESSQATTNTKSLTPNKNFKILRSKSPLWKGRGISLGLPSNYQASASAYSDSRTKWVSSVESVKFRHCSSWAWLICWTIVLKTCCDVGVGSGVPQDRCFNLENLSTRFI